MLNILEVVETNNMIEKENLDVRTITLGISLLDCIDSDLNKVEKVLNELSKRLPNQIEDIKGIVTVDGIDELGDSGITYRIIAETKPTKNIPVERLIRKEIKMEFDKNNINIPFPQVVIHND